MFDGVWACASLLHVEKNDIDDVFRRIVSSLVSGGIFNSSFKYGDKEIVRNGRLFSNYNEESFTALIANHPALMIVKMWQTTDIRKKRRNRRTSIGKGIPL